MSVLTGEIEIINELENREAGDVASQIETVLCKASNVVLGELFQIGRQVVMAPVVTGIYIKESAVTIGGMSQRLGSYLVKYGPIQGTKHFALSVTPQEVATTMLSARLSLYAQYFGSHLITSLRGLGDEILHGHNFQGTDEMNFSVAQQQVIDCDVNNDGNIDATYTVQAGNNLTRIAAACNTTVGEIQRVNELPNANVLTVGQVLKIPGGAAGTNGAPPTFPTAGPQPTDTPGALPTESSSPGDQLDPNNLVHTVPAGEGEKGYGGIIAVTAALGVGLSALGWALRDKLFPAPIEYQSTQGPASGPNVSRSGPTRGGVPVVPRGRVGARPQPRRTGRAPVRPIDSSPLRVPVESQVEQAEASAVEIDGMLWKDGGKYLDDSGLPYDTRIVSLDEGRFVVFTWYDENGKVSQHTAWSEDTQNQLPTSDAVELGLIEEYRPQTTQTAKPIIPAPKHNMSPKTPVVIEGSVQRGEDTTVILPVNPNEPTRVQLSQQHILDHWGSVSGKAVWVGGAPLIPGMPFEEGDIKGVISTKKGTAYVNCDSGAVYRFDKETFELILVTGEEA